MRRFALGMVAAALTTVVGCSSEGDPTVDEVEISGLTEDGKADHLGTRVTLGHSRGLWGGTNTVLRFRVYGPWGDPVGAFVEEHTRLFHLIVVSEDLSYFRHLHPSYRGEGVFTLNWTPPAQGDRYHLFAQLRPTGQPAGLTRRFDLRVPGSSILAPTPVTPDRGDYAVQGDQVILLEGGGASFARGPQDLHFMVHDLSSGEMVSDVEPFLGARAHLIAIQARRGGQVFQHAHDMGEGSGHGGHSSHGAAASDFDPTGMFQLRVDFPNPGTYRVWLQYGREGRTITQPFTVSVR